jgi:hypothetical protein
MGLGSFLVYEIFITLIFWLNYSAPILKKNALGPSNFFNQEIKPTQA